MAETRKVVGISQGLFSTLYSARKRTPGSPGRERRQTRMSPDRLALLARPKSGSGFAPLSARVHSRERPQAGLRGGGDWAFSTDSLVRQTREDDLEAANDASRLHSQQSTERREASDFRQRENYYKLEIARLQEECASLQDTAKQAKSQAAATTKEKERLQVEAEILRKSLSYCRTSFKKLTEFLIDRIEEATQVGSVEAVETVVTAKLREVAEYTKTDLASELQRVARWRSQGTSAASTMKQIQFDEIPDCENSEEADSLESVKRNVMLRIAGSQQNDTKALALFDFQGTEVSSMKPGDLSFRRGDHVAVLKRDPEGWWLGRCGDSVGIFPYNYVRLL